MPAWRLLTHKATRADRTAGGLEFRLSMICLTVPREQLEKLNPKNRNGSGSFPKEAAQQHVAPASGGFFHA